MFRFAKDDYLFPRQMPSLHRRSRLKHELNPADMKNYRPISNLELLHVETSGQRTNLVLALLDVIAAFDTYGRSLHPARPVVHLVRTHEIGVRSDAVVHRRSHADSSLLWICLALRGRAFWCDSRLGARPSPYVLYTADIQNLVRDGQ